MPARINFGCILSGDSNGHFFTLNRKFGSSNKETKEIYKQVLNYEQDAVSQFCSILLSGTRTENVLSLLNCSSLVSFLMKDNPNWNDLNDGKFQA